VKLSSKYGQMYQCSFPNTVEQEKQKGEAEKVAMETGIPDLLKPMESGPCLRKVGYLYKGCLSMIQKSYPKASAEINLYFKMIKHARHADVF